MSDPHALAHAFWQDQPHPQAPSLKIGEFATAVKLATALKFGGHATPAEAETFWPEFQKLGMSPEDFIHAVDRLAPLSFTYHGRPPSMREIHSLTDRPPKEARSYFADLPDQHYPHVSAGEMVAQLAASEPHAREHLKRPPVKFEAQYLIHSRQDPALYYQRLAERSRPTMATKPDGVSTEGGGRPPGSGDDSPGRRSPDK